MNTNLEAAINNFETLPLPSQLAIAIKPNGLATHFNPFIGSPSQDMALLNQKLKYLESPLIDYCRKILAEKDQLLKNLENKVEHITLNPSAIASTDEATQKLLNELAFEKLSIEQKYAFITLIKTIQLSNS